LKALAEKTFHDLESVAVWIDGIQVGDYNFVCAVGVDFSGEKHVLGGGVKARRRMRKS
jgi:hypothetical protein